MMYMGVLWIRVRKYIAACTAYVGSGRVPARAAKLRGLRNDLLAMTIVQSQRMIHSLQRP